MLSHKRTKSRAPGRGPMSGHNNVSITARFSFLDKGIVIENYSDLLFAGRLMTAI